MTKRSGLLLDKVPAGGWRVRKVDRVSEIPAVSVIRQSHTFRHFWDASLVCRLSDRQKSVGEVTVWAFLSHIPDSEPSM